MRWALLGTGRIAARSLLPALAAAGQQVVRVGSRDPDRAGAFAEEHGIPSAGDYGDAIAADDVEAVYLPLPNALHEAWATAALEAGKHVLCEKPLATDAAAAARMQAAAQRSGRLLMEAAMVRYHPRTEALLDLVWDGAIGPLRWMSAAFSFPMTRADDIRADPDLGGGALLDIGFYTAAISRWLARDEPEVVAASGEVSGRGVDVATASLLRFPGGATAALRAGFDAPLHQEVTVVGADGVLRVPKAFTAGAADDAVLLRDDVPIMTVRADPFERMVRAFADAAETGTPAPLDPADAIATARVLDAIRAAAFPA